MVLCPECDTNLDVDEESVDEGEAISCPECGTDFEVVTASPLELKAVEAGYEAEEELEEETEDGDYSLNPPAYFAIALSIPAGRNSARPHRVPFALRRAKGEALRAHLRHRLGSGQSSNLRRTCKNPSLHRQAKKSSLGFILRPPRRIRPARSRRRSRLYPVRRSQRCEARRRHATPPSRRSQSPHL